MHVPRTPLNVATALAAVMLLVTACMGGAETAKSQQTDATTPSVQVSESVAAPTPTPVVTPSQTITSAMPSAPPQFSRLNAPSVYQPDTAPISQDRNGTVNVPAYVQAVMRSNRDVWRATFEANGLLMPALTYDVTSQSDRYVSACLRGGKPIEVTAAYGRLFYCTEDSKPNGAIALPTGVIAELWKKGASRKVADLAGAITVSRTSALILITSLQRELGLPTPESASRQYVAACLSGLWAHGVYNQNAFTEKELAVALEHAYKIGIEVNGEAASVDPTNQLITAWVVGFRGGKVGDCGTSYWR